MEVKLYFTMLCFVTKNKIMDNVQHISVHWYTITILKTCLIFMLLTFSRKSQTVLCSEYREISIICPCISHKIFSNICNFFTRTQAKPPSFRHEQQFTKQVAVVVILSLYSEASILCSQILCFTPHLYQLYIWSWPNAHTNNIKF